MIFETSLSCDFTLNFMNIGVLLPVDAPSLTFVQLIFHISQLLVHFEVADFVNLVHRIVAHLPRRRKIVYHGCLLSDIVHGRIGMVSNHLHLRTRLGCNLTARTHQRPLLESISLQQSLLLRSLIWIHLCLPVNSELRGHHLTTSLS